MRSARTRMGSSTANTLAMKYMVPSLKSDKPMFDITHQ